MMRKMSTTGVVLVVLVVLMLVFAGCEGPVGPSGADGAEGTSGTDGSDGSGGSGGGVTINFPDEILRVSTSLELYEALENTDRAVIEMQNDIAVPFNVDLGNHKWLDVNSHELDLDGTIITTGSNTFIVSGSDVIDGRFEIGTNGALVLGDTVRMDAITINGADADSTLRGTVETLDGDANAEITLAGALELDRAALGDLVVLDGSPTITGSVIANTFTQLDQIASELTDPVTDSITIGADLEVDSNLTLGAAVTIADGVTLTIANSATLTANGAIDGSGTGTINGTGSLVLADAAADLTDVTLDVATTVNAAVTFDGVTASNEITIAGAFALTFANSADLSGLTIVFGSGATLAGDGVATELLVQSLSADSGASTPVISVSPLDAWDNTGGETITLNSSAIDLSGVDNGDVTNATASGPAAGTVTLTPTADNTTAITVDDANITTLATGQDIEVIRDGVTYQATVQ